MGDGRRSIERGDHILRKDPGFQHAPYEIHEGGKNAEPSEVLWIEFPSPMHIDEMDLGRAFAPFGEIEEVTIFPGRTHAFVRYRSVVAACRAKEALQGRLFNNPEVNICFARNDLAPEQGRYPANSSSHLNTKPYLLPTLGGRFGETVQQERNFDDSVEEPPVPSPRFFSDMQKFPRDARTNRIGRNGPIGIDASSAVNSGVPFENSKFRGTERKMLEDSYDQSGYGSLLGRGDIQQDIAVERPRRGPHFENSWDIENTNFPLAKKMRSNTFPDRELTEYPFTDFQKRSERPVSNRYSDLPEHQLNGTHFDSVPPELKKYPENPKNINYPLESVDFWKASDAHNAGPGSLHKAVLKFEGHTPESHQPLKDEWKWEGTIAKGGTPVCRARCFPVGKVLDMMLPEFLDCTARTGVDMLAKHFYQAASSWVVFFVPETDADIVYYNEFMHYLGEKQRAAVAKLGEKTSLFLVPPSEFSEHVLKVPGKLSISGVILRFQQGNSNVSAPTPVEMAESDATIYLNRDLHNDALKSKHISPDFSSYDYSYLRSSLGNIVPPALPSGPSLIKSDGTTSYSTNEPHVGKFPGSATYGSYDHLHHPNPDFSPNWPQQDMQVSGTHNGSVSSQGTNPAHLVDNHIGLEYSASKSNLQQGVGSNHYIPQNPEAMVPGSGEIPPPQETTTQVTLPAPLQSLQPEQLAQLAAALLEQKQLGKQRFILSDGDQTLPVLSKKIGFPANPPLLDASVQFNNLHLLQQPMPAINQAVDLETHNSQQVQPHSREESETDPQIRLQATAQLAAAIMQKLQQQPKGDQH